MIPLKNAVKLKETSKETASFIQKNLIALGLLEPPVDGIPGPLTHKAWARFKRAVQTLNLDAVSPNDLTNLQACIDHFKEQPDNLIITKAQLKEVFLREPTDAQVADLNECLIANEIITPQRIAHFLAQTGHESGGLKWLTELADGSAYEGRKDLGNTQPGDGKRYKGSSVIQITGRYNYQKFAEYIDDERVMEGCNYVAQNYPFSAAGWFWTTRNLNKLCDSGASVTAITKVVNGGHRGLEDRLAYYNRAQKMLAQRQSLLAQVALQQ